MGLVGLSGELVAMTIVLAVAPRAGAHHDPSGCFGAGVDVDIFGPRRKRCSVTLNRACSVDADCPAGETCALNAAIGAIAPCETLFYEAFLSHDGDPTKCAFEGGTFTLTLPSGSTAVINDVPCLGGTLTPCVPGTLVLPTGLVPYVVDPADFNPGTRVITATASYTGGDTHDGGGLLDDSGDTVDSASGSQGFSVGVISCDDNNDCTIDVCNPAFVGAAACQHTQIVCDDNDVCTDDACVPGQGCVNTPNPSNDPSCAPVGCRLTGGGITPNGEIDVGVFAEVQDARHGGQVGAPCGCIGCFDELDHIQGNWVHQRKKQKTNLKAADFNSLVCGCRDVNGGPGVFDGKLCNPDDRDAGPEPRPAPANIACFTGTGALKRNGKTTDVAFRVEVEDRGEPGAGDNAEPTADVYRMRIWVPKGTESVASLAAGACCTHADPVGEAARHPDIDDGGNITQGNLQIHPQIPSHVGECPIANGSCSE